MNITHDRIRSIGWAACLVICFAMTLALTFRVNAVKSQVRLTERRIVALQEEKAMLETEFETRANQQQLKTLNDLEFGYSAPTAGQYLEGERQLAALGKPRAPGAPSPVRVASAVIDDDSSHFPAMLNPLTGRAMAAEMPRTPARKPISASSLGDRLSHVDDRGAVRE
jgi:hypothetical protein